MRPLTVLVVDDNDSFRKELVECLAIQAGVEIKGQARNGSEAIGLVRTLDPDLVLMDISMPVMDGIEATKQIKAQSSRTKVVIVTIHEEVTYRQLAEYIRADGFLSKSSVKRDIPKVLDKIRSEFGYQ